VVPGAPDGAGQAPFPQADAGTRHSWRDDGRAAAGPAAQAYWRGWPEIRADLRSAVGLVLVFAVAGLVAGLLWWWLAPRADFRITDSVPVPIGNPSEELLIADDTVLMLILAGMGLAGGAAAWFLRRRRGVATVLALAVGGSAMAAVAWQLGELLGAGPTKAQLGDVGTVVTTSLTLGSLPALAIAPFAALLAYVVPVLSVPGDDLGRTGGGAPVHEGTPLDGPDREAPGLSDERSPVDVPPPGRPTV
jgi:hypothetical protein